MVRTLRITSIAAVVGALALVVLLVVSGLRDDAELEEFLSSAGVVEKFKADSGKASQNEDRISPLLRQAQAFAKGINPPPKPKPRPAKASGRPASERAVAPQPKQPVTAKFKLVATCRYEDQPQRSLALLDMPAKGLKWFRQGEKVGHLVLEQIKDGSIVYNDGKKTSELFAPKPKTKSLLKSEAVSAAPNKPVTPAVSHRDVVEIPAAKPKASEKTPKAEDSALSRRGVTRRRAGRRTEPATARSAKTVESKPKVSDRQESQKTAAGPTPEERKKILKENIAGIKKIMNEARDSRSSRDTKKDRETMEKLLNILEKEEREIDK